MEAALLHQWSFIILLTLPALHADVAPVWQEWNGHRYLFSVKFAHIPDYSYWEASEYCRSIGGHLASSLSEEENGYLVINKQSLYETCWIGLYIETGDGPGCDKCMACSRERFLQQSNNCDVSMQTILLHELCDLLKLAK